MRTIEDTTNPIGKFVCSKQSIGLYNFSLAVHPLGLDGVQPRALFGQKTAHDPNPFATLFDPSVVFAEPSPHLLGDVPTGVVPDEKKDLLAKSFELLATPLKKPGSYVTHRPAIDEPQPRLLEFGHIEPVAGYSLRSFAGVVLGAQPGFEPFALLFRQFPNENWRLHGSNYSPSHTTLSEDALVSILGAILAVFGVIALGAYLASSRSGRLALLAMVLSVAGHCLVLTIFGFSTIISPVIGRLYLEGQPAAMEVNEAIFSSPAFGFLVVPGLLFYVVGAILFGVAIWRSGMLPKWAGVLYAPTGLLIAAGVLIGAAQTLGSALLVVAGGWIAWSLMRQPSSQPGAEAQPRVQ